MSAPRSTSRSRSAPSNHGNSKIVNSNSNNTKTQSSVASIQGSSKSKEERNNNFKVVIRVRPPLPRELSGEIPFQNTVACDDTEQMITISENIDAIVDERGHVLANPGPYSIHTFFFDHVYDQRSSQRKVFETTARDVVDSALQGYNSTIFAYGQTGTGKTYTMEGFNQDGSLESRGIIPRAIEQIFSHIQRHASPRMRFLVRASYLQIYDEKISDLLKPERNNLAIREDKRRGIFVDGLSEWVVRSPAEIYGLMERGGAMRATGETKMNEVSSRSHAVFIVIAEQSETVYVDDSGVEMSPEDFQKFMHARGVHRGQEMSKLEDHIRQSFKVGKLNLVDLAGSERVALSGATGQRFKETTQINTALTHLGNVIAALTENNGKGHIPYRNSKLTRMLEDSLGGNCRTTMMAMISPALEAMVESLSTLKFANRAKRIRNEARVNEDLDQKSLLRKYERELKKLRAELEERNKNVVDKRRLLELDEQRKRAEADKMAAIKALEVRSQEFLMEKEEKRKLEQRIALLMGQMIRGERPAVINGQADVSVDGDPEIQNMMKEQQDKLRQEYEDKLADLERERESIEEEKAQVDRYKQLLLKQRDIMIALTQRLVERDEQIMALQDELDAYDRHQRELEEKLDEKTAQLITLQRITMEASTNPSRLTEEITKALIQPNRETNSFSQEKGLGRLSRGTESALEVIHTSDDDDQSPIPSLGFVSVSKNNDYNMSTLSSTKIQQIIQLELDQKLNKLAETPELRVLRDPLATIVKQIFQSLQQAGLNDQNASSVYATNSTRNSMNGGNMEELQRLRFMNEKLESRVRELSLVKATPTSDSYALQSKCDTLLKEREAVQTIMEQKIKVLVQSVAQAANAVVAASNTSTPPQQGAAQALTKDVAALQRLVNASIAALRNAAANGSGGSSNSSTSATMTSSSASSSSVSSINSTNSVNMNNTGTMYRASSVNSIPIGSMTGPPASMINSNLPASPSKRHSNSFSGLPSSSLSSGPSSNQGTTSYSDRFSYDPYPVSVPASVSMSAPTADSRIMGNRSSLTPTGGTRMTIDGFLGRSNYNE